MTLLAVSSVLSCTVFAEAPTIDTTETNRQICSYELSNPLAADAVEPLPYNDIEPKHYYEAFNRNLIAQKIRLLEIRDNPNKPTFENTIKSIATLTEGTDRVLKLVATLDDVLNSKKMSAIWSNLATQSWEFDFKVNTDRQLLDRVKAVEAMGPLNRLSEEEKALLEKVKNRFLDLSVDKLKRFKEIEGEETNLTQTFARRIVKATNEFVLVLSEKDVAGMPENTLAIAKEAAIRRGKPSKWVFTLKASSYNAFMKFNSNRELRHKIWLALNTRGAQRRFNTLSLIPKIISLRHEMGKIREEGSFVNFRLKDSMAKNSENVYAFLNGQIAGFRPAAQAEVAQLEELAGHKIEAWDFEFYREVWKRERLQFDPEDYRPYFAFDNVLKGGFFAAEKLFGVKFVERPNLQEWHDTVRTYEVLSRTGEHLGFYYVDPFPREGKREGMWSAVLVEGGQYRGQKQRPHVLNILNVTPPTNDIPSLLSPDDVRSVFHEMGHALHKLLSRVGYNSLFGTKVARDLVEFPSVLFEQWAFEPEVMQHYARHYKTDEVLPDQMIQKFRESEKVGQALDQLLRLFRARLDMDWHTKPLGDKSVEEFENEVRREVMVIPAPGAIASASFRHSFCDGYEALVYSYPWNDNSVADALVPFEENGMFDPMTAFRLHSQVFEAGATASPEIIYSRFRGQNPDPKALLKRQGYLPQ